MLKNAVDNFSTGDYLQAVYLLKFSYTETVINAFRAMLNNYIYLAYLFKLNTM